MENILKLSIYGEMYIIDLNKVMFFEADDHYTHVHLAQGTTFMVPFGLSRIEEELMAINISASIFFMRLGRKYIVNLRRIYHINVMKQQLLLSDDHGNPHNLQLSKPVLRSLMEMFSNNK